ncbi:MAG TPA: YceI family protein [Solirubrobacteraceae bacterium]|jgi:polyisoprenoid-binding protein YceI|nr:YceI family protein [Solirubrobacteraceae bacterium]
MDPFENNRWELDAAESTAEFRARTYWGLVGVRGHFGRLSGAVSADGGLELVIDAASLDTGNHIRDRHLRSGDFFDVERHPQVRFSAAGVDETADGGARVSGRLEAAGEAVQLELAPSVRPVGDDALELDAETTIDQRQLGMTYRRFGIRVPATVAVHAVLRRA